MKCFGPKNKISRPEFKRSRSSENQKSGAVRDSNLNRKINNLLLILGSLLLLKKNCRTKFCWHKTQPPDNQDLLRGRQAALANPNPRTLTANHQPESTFMKLSKCASSSGDKGWVQLPSQYRLQKDMCVLQSILRNTLPFFAVKGRDTLSLVRYCCAGNATKTYGSYRMFVIVMSTSVGGRLPSPSGC